MKLKLLLLLFVFFGLYSSASHLYAKDSTIKTVGLKSGYKLAYKKLDSIIFIAVEKDKSSIELGEGEADAKMPLDVLGYLYADFDKYFAVAVHIDANPIKVSIYDKTTGGLLMYGLTPFYVDTLKGLLMYEGAYGKKGKLILFDAKTGKAKLFDAPTDTPCFCCFCWKVTEITDAEIKIEYINLKQQKVVKTYERK
jgi:hypothetical protein